ncbi:alkaline phosphatase PhoX [Fluviibacterium sp. DFM31]|uniref:Alkaline phosphatase PhoX n=1 Tax=Meridianimarinicoccus marinus TaxID=3231483 RepID=A0ABV3L2F7_9RHOB
MKKTVALLLAATALTSAAQADSLVRVLTAPLGAEITGLYEQGGDLFANMQHPDGEIGGAFSKAVVGVISNVNWTGGEHAAPTDEAARKTVTSTLGDYQILLSEGENGVGVITSIAGEELLVSNDPDFNGFIPTGANTGFLFTNWENRPGGMSRAALTRADNGRWSVDGVEMLDFSSVGGTWVNCFGTVSPWGTPLTSEELYFDDTADWNNPEYKYVEDTKVLAAYLGEDQYPNPYDYGYIVEITDPTDTAAPVKHFALGRFSHENAVVMPDQKTVYLSDDGTGVVFFKFIADTAGDLSAGTLFAAKIVQDGPAGADAGETALNIHWIELAHGSNDEIASWITEYDGIGLDDYSADATNYITDEDVAAWAAGEATDNRVAFLESRKAAVAKGATGEFRKMEGVNINLDGAADGSVPFMYMAMSSIGKTMSDGEGDIDLAENKCGVVYEMELDASFDVARMVPVVAGFGYNKDNAPNACPVASVSNPDNLIVRKDGSVLIGEDTSSHENNALWIYTKGQQS